MGHFELYLIMILDQVSGISKMVTCVCLTVFVVLSVFRFIMVMEDYEEGAKMIRPWLKPLGISGAIFLLLHMFTPTTNQAAVIYVLPKVVNNENVQEISEDLVELTRIWIDKQIESAKGEE